MSGMRGDKNESEAFYSYTSFTFPSAVYKYNIAATII